MISTAIARKKLGLTAKKMTDQEIDKLLKNLYSLISQIIDNNLDKIKLCKKQ